MHQTCLLFVGLRRDECDEGPLPSCSGLVLLRRAVGVHRLLSAAWPVDRRSRAAEVIFAPGEIAAELRSLAAGKPAAAGLRRWTPARRRTPAGVAGCRRRRTASASRADASTAPLVFFFCCAVAWLLVASAAGLTASISCTSLTGWCSRPGHLRPHPHPCTSTPSPNGWAPMAGLGIALFVIPRLLKTPLLGALCLRRRGAVERRADRRAGQWLSAGINDGLEWLEIPWQIGILFAVGGALIGLPGLHAGQPARRAPLRVGLVHGLRAVLAAGAVRRRQVAGRAPGRAAGGDELVVGHNVLGLWFRRWRWPRCTTSCLGDRRADRVVQPCCSILGAGPFYGRSAATT